MSETGEMREILAELPAAVCFGRLEDSSIFVSTGVSYPNGVGAVVRIDRDRHGFALSDDGYACRIAETMNTVNSLNRIAAGVASRAGVFFERGTFFLGDVERKTLPVAVVSVANASCRAVERMIASLEQPRIKKSRDIFDRRLRAAFGDSVKFDLEYRGATGKHWDFDAGLERRGEIVRLFELVQASTQSIAIANMKITDTRSAPDAPLVIAALADYEHTEPALRSILSNAGGTVISASAAVSEYQKISS